MRLPTGAKQILDARMSGNRPADILLVSNIGKLPDDNPQVLTDGTGYDWRFLTGLDFIMFGKVNDAMMDNLQAICQQSKKTKQMLIWDQENEAGVYAWYLPVAETIDRPQDKWEWEFSFMPWTEYQNNKFKGG